MGARRRFGEYPFWGVAAIVAALTVGLVVLGLELGWGGFAYLLVVLPVGVAIAYLVSYSRLTPPEEERTQPPPGPSILPAEEEPFVDPVEEADRIASGEIPPSSPTEEGP